MIKINTLGEEEKGFIFNVQKYNIHDGPGIRTLIFFKGCPLRCLWCSNPEGLSRQYEIMYNRKNCTDCGNCVEVCPVGIHKFDKDSKHFIDRNIECIGCGKCEEACNDFAITVSGQGKTVDELIEIIEEDRMFYYTSGGGVTLGGGEVLMQAGFATKLLKKCKERRINTAIESSGYAKKEALLELAKYVDLFLFDIKHMNSQRHYELTGVYNDVILENLKEIIMRGYDIKIRMPMLKGINDSRHEINQVIDFLTPYKDYGNFKGIELLPYHKMGVNKYEQLNMDYGIKEDPSLTGEELKTIKSWVEEYDFPVSIL